MAKFLYKMQNILDIKNKLETQAKTIFAQASERLRIEKLKLNELYDDIEVYKDKIRELNKNYLNIHELKACMNGIEMKKHAIEEQVIQINIAEKDLEIARKKLNEVMIDRKTHEKLREKSFEEFKAELESVEKKEVDELVSFKYNKYN